MRGELPIDVSVGVVSAVLPRLDLVAHFVQVVDVSIQTLPSHHVDFDFSHVEPRTVLGCVDELEAIPERLGLFGRERLV